MKKNALNTSNIYFFYDICTRTATDRRNGKQNYWASPKRWSIWTVTGVDQSGQTLSVQRPHNIGVHMTRARYKKAFTANSQKRETSEIAKGINDGATPEDIRYLDENILLLYGGIPIEMNWKVVGGIGLGGDHSSEDVRIAKAGLKNINY